jgi:hypothetical protein
LKSLRVKNLELVSESREEIDRAGEQDMKNNPECDQ